MILGKHHIKANFIYSTIRRGHEPYDEANLDLFLQQIEQLAQQPQYQQLHIELA